MELYHASFSEEVILEQLQSITVLPERHPYDIIACLLHICEIYIFFIQLFKSMLLLLHDFLAVLPVRVPGRLQLDLLAVLDVIFEGLIDQQSITEDSTRSSFFELASHPLLFF